ncbi:YugN-like family protein [Peribacillus sp. SCS-37]|uniref:YugN-like family protein n=1 Tax=Paraperibacillus esterisolvens TaxID=3115296 RepID=UPI003905A0ED
MIEIPSQLEGHTFSLYDLEQTLKPRGYSISGSWDYDHAYFDYKIDSRNGYQFLRVPFRAVEGGLDTRGAAVMLGRPFLLSHQYKKGPDDHAGIGNFSASFNQFQEPAEKDAEFPDRYVELGKSLVKELESILLPA